MVTFFTTNVMKNAHFHIWQIVARATSHAGGTQGAPRGHAGGTQGAPRGHPGGTQGAPRGHAGGKNYIEMGNNTWSATFSMFLKPRHSDVVKKKVVPYCTVL